MGNKENLKVRKEIVVVKGMTIEFEEYYKIDDITGEEIFDREIEIENDLRLYDIYKKKKGLLTSNQIKNIRNKYEMTQKEFAIAIGVGEITIHRFENGSIQTDSIDAIIRLSEDPDNMYELLMKNQTNLLKLVYNKIEKKIKELQNLKKHRIANFKLEDFNNEKIQTFDVEKIANILIERYNNKCNDLTQIYNIDKTICNEYITQLKLQKLLYYIQGLSLAIFKKPAFTNKILAWDYGPVVDEIYQRYKRYKGVPIKNKEKNNEINNGLNKIIDIVIDSYGQLEIKKLIDLTHEEEPWLKTNKNDEIDINLMKIYFEKVYQNKSK
jgi:putative zinc finger/helix-turn-helix YgiT family protein